MWTRNVPNTKKESYQMDRDVLWFVSLNFRCRTSHIKCPKHQFRVIVICFVCFSCDASWRCTPRGPAVQSLPVEEQCCVCLALLRKGKWKPRRTCPSLCCSSLSVGFLCTPSTVCRPSARTVRFLSSWRTSASFYHMPTQPWIHCCTPITCGILELLWRACCAVCLAPRKTT